MTSAEKLKAIIEVNKRLIGKTIFSVSENAFGVVLDVIDEETYLVNFRGISKRISMFDVRATE